MRNPFFFISSTCAGHISMKVTSSPPRTIWAPVYPPTAPVPTTAIRLPMSDLPRLSADPSAPFAGARDGACLCGDVCYNNNYEMAFPCDKINRRAGRRVPLPRPCRRGGIPLPAARPNCIQAFDLEWIFRVAAAFFEGKNAFVPDGRGIGALLRPAECR